ncbi:MAG: hypothetical protein LBP75_06080 [Planctomycetota bacterium]|jgi:tetratricopeptide (TPR) repeat protein|nr:hypothetical protein [Planctomycetota bacterium]
MNLRICVAILAVLSVVGISVGARARVWAQTDAVKPQFIDVKRLVRAPHQFNRQAVVFTCRFAKRGELFRQDADLFTPKEYVNFVVWPVEAELWDKTARRNLLSSLYVRKDNHEALAALESLSRYDTVKIAGFVEEVYANLPWIAVEKIAPITGEAIDDEMLKQIATGDRLLEQGKVAEAKETFAQAVSQGAPAFVRQHIETVTANYEAPRAITQRPLENYMPLVEAARKAARASDFTDAESYYLEARRKAANHAWLYKEIGLFYEYRHTLNPAAGQLEKALGAYRQAETLNGAPDADLQFLKARVAFALGKDRHQFGEAAAYLANCLQIAPEHPLARQLDAELTSAKLAMTRDIEAMASARDAEPHRDNAGVIANAPAATPSQAPQLARAEKNPFIDRSDLPTADEFDDLIITEDLAPVARTEELWQMDAQVAAIKKEMTPINADVLTVASAPITFADDLRAAAGAMTLPAENKIAAAVNSVNAVGAANHDRTAPEFKAENNVSLSEVLDEIPALLPPQKSTRQPFAPLSAEDFLPDDIPDWAL